MRRLSATLAIAGFIAALVPARPALACSCAFASPKEAAEHAEAIFTGTAIASEGDEFRKATTTFAVETVYRGPADAEISIDHQVQSTACGLTFDEGEIYTVFAYETPRSEGLETNICWPTGKGEVDPQRFDLQATPIAQTQQQPDSPADADEVWPLWALLGGLVLVIGGLATWGTRRRRR